MMFRKYIEVKIVEEDEKEGKEDEKRNENRGREGKREAHLDNPIFAYETSN